MKILVDNIFHEEMSGDKSFKEKGGFLSALFGGKTYNQTDMRETWDSGIKYGIEIGLRRASLEGQKIQLNSNTTKTEHIEFLEKFYKLCEDYGCAIQFHPHHGMVVVNNKPTRPTKVYTEKDLINLDKK